MQTDITIVSPPPATRRCDAIVRTGRNSNRSCKAVASYYDPRRKKNLCGVHADGAPRGTGPSWYETQRRADGFDAAAPGEMCASGRHPYAARQAKAVKNGILLCFLCSFDSEIADLNDDRIAA